MAMIEGIDSVLLTEAALLWVGKGISSFPLHEDSRLVTRFGEDITAKILPVLKSLEKEFWASDAWSKATTLQEMAEMVSRDFRKIHPEIPEKIVEAFAWCYKFNNR